MTTECVLAIVAFVVFVAYVVYLWVDVIRSKGDKLDKE